MKKKEIEPKVIEAFKNSKYRWRTIRGVSKQTNIPPDKLYKLIEKSDLFIRAKKSNREGQPLFALREKYNQETPFGVKLLNAITNKIH